ncbi:thermonuclease family protein [Candidatus Symbiobacter mobilis]|uniref:Nuclease-like protein n=1 Tax=Candidatus Symbiobacter mobilis CR TaxID=946483 RepID=U5NAK6_9BURK|nr:thermonuclease family protein [Candidatus Symbiobacter mobilis]AGX88417.1 nuclease-like protein [Candidatus Symbiobacter mobilis CR]
MKPILTFVASLTILALAACGGGDDPEPSTSAPSTWVAATEATPVPVAQPPLQLELDAPSNNLDLAPNASFATSNTVTFCGYTVPSTSMVGVVTSVHDGDTIKLGSTTVRLDAIDAPELAQTYGTQSRDNLKSLVEGKSVTVYYSKVDKYGRTVGSVFTSGCVFANLQQVRSGSAWHYKQYQCEQPADLRIEFAAAQSAAESADLDLWAFVATPPWVYRNGTDPTPPTCTSDDPVWSAPATTTLTTPVVTPSTSTGTSTKPYTPVTGCKTVWINSYTRKDGTKVKGHYRTTCY